MHFKSEGVRACNLGFFFFSDYNQITLNFQAEFAKSHC
jgi:hypothetical protein